MRRLALLVLLLGATFALFAERRASLIDERRILAAEHPAIDYWNAQPSDAVARLQQRLESGAITLDYHRRFGYLPAVLRALDIPVSSQVLVFSKTSFQASRIFPRIPRAIYHSEEAAVGWVRGGDVVEVASLDPTLGVVFYTLDQVPSARPRFESRTTACISCHVGSITSGVPGLLVRSVHPDRSGVPARKPSFITDHRSPLSERWGGWYVSGEHGSQKHLGNAIYERGEASSLFAGGDPSNVVDLSPFVNPNDYLSGHSDIVSLMILEHQTRMTNLIVRLGYETRIAMSGKPADLELSDLPERARTDITNAAEEMLRYMLFTDEALLEEPVRGSSEFAKEFAARGREDAQGRSLHELDLSRRLLRYPCSYLIYSDAFESLPAPAKDYVYRRLWEILTSKDETDDFASLAADDRTAIREILVDTKTDLPSYFSGNADTRAQAQRLESVLKAAGIPATSYGKSDSNHSGLNDDLGKPGDPTTGELHKFLHPLVGK